MKLKLFIQIYTQVNHLIKEESENVKEVYETPDMEIIEFGSEDVITTSGEIGFDPDADY